MERIDHQSEQSCPRIPLETGRLEIHGRHILPQPLSNAVGIQSGDGSQPLVITGIPLLQLDEAGRQPGTGNPRRRQIRAQPGLLIPQVREAGGPIAE
ncbi:MAG: hypothetical protein CMJ41_08770 [Phycisphaerae bacterium]|nr:hypothetical protein [Phycisphaerae bacterium]HBZ96926.1 hypothetical protein [Phycisphaerales bacterium]